MSSTNEELSVKLSANGAALKPSSVKGGLAPWFYGSPDKPGSGKIQNIAELCGGETEAKRLYVACMVYITNRPDLMECDQRSLQQAIMQCAVLGLSPGFLNECDFLCFKKIAKFCPGYAGLVKLAIQGESVTDISSQVVYSKDEFDFSDGTDAFLRHKKFLGPQDQRGERVAAYATARLQNGQFKFEVITPDQWESIRAKSKGANSEYSPWSKADKDPFEYDWMVRKTAVKQLSKLIPKSIKSLKFAQALALDNAAERPDISGNQLALPVYDETEFTSE